VDNIGNRTISGTWTLLEPDAETFCKRLLQLCSAPLDMTASVPQVVDRLMSTFFANGSPKMTEAFYGNVAFVLVDSFREVLPPWVAVNGAGRLRVKFELPMAAPVKLYVNREPIKMQTFYLQGETERGSVEFAFTHDLIFSLEQQEAMKQFEEELKIREGTNEYYD
jgi:hypothetical protein